jgi:hypothetical protein
MAVGAALAPGHTLAQVSLQGDLSQGPISNFARDRNIAVTDRSHPEYQALGIHAGSLFLWPKMSVSQEYDSNVFATSGSAVADGVSHITPELDLTSDWSRHWLSAYVRGVFNQYWQNSNQNTNDVAVGAQGRLDVQHLTSVNAGVNYSRLTEPRTTAPSEGSAFPIQYDLTSAFLSGQKEFNRLRLSARADWQRFRYEDRVGVAPQGDRDHSNTVVTGRADYALSPDTALFVEVSGNKRNYVLTSSPIINGAPQFPDFVNRNSSGVEVLAGANFELGALVRGELAAGYLDQQYHEANFGHVTGPGARAQLQWFPSQLITVTLAATRTVEDAGIPGAAAYQSQNVSLKVDHELLRNVILSANGAYDKDDYKGISRHDQRFTAGFGATLLVNRRVGLTLGYNYFKQNSTGDDPSVLSGNYSVSTVGATLNLQY